MVSHRQILVQILGSVIGSKWPRDQSGFFLWLFPRGGGEVAFSASGVGSCEMQVGIWASGNSPPLCGESLLGEGHEANP